MRTYRGNKITRDVAKRAEQMGFEDVHIGRRSGDCCGLRNLMADLRRLARTA